MPSAIFAYPDFENLGVEYLMSIALEHGYQTDLVFYEAEDVYLGQSGSRKWILEFCERYKAEIGRMCHRADRHSIAV